MIAAIDWVVAHRNDDTANPIKVINLSYGSGGTPPAWTDPLQFAVEKAWQAGIVVVAAAGNNGNAAGTLTNPARDEWILAVGATATNGTTATADDTLATFTNLSSSSANQVDLLAPGTSIASLRNPGSHLDNTYPTARVGTTLFKGSGTSQATAVVSGAAALAAAAAAGLEGVIAKRLTSNYHPGRRSPDWVKVPLSRTQEVVIIGTSRVVAAAPAPSARWSWPCRIRPAG